MADDPNQRPIPYLQMAFHAALAGIFFFSLNRFVLAQPLETALTWGVIAAPFAAFLAYSQSRR